MTLLEAEFFGVAPGAYTGADRKGRDGKFKLADGGTLFLDEIGDMPLALQAKLLLRVLQEQELEPLGSNQVLKVNVRVIAATSRDLARRWWAKGRFRADLYYRLHVLPIRLPALRERLADLEPLADALLDDIARRSGLPHKALSADALDRLAAHHWPGNIAELRNVLEQAALMTDGLVLAGADIAAALRTGGADCRLAGRCAARRRGRVWGRGRGRDLGGGRAADRCVPAAVATRAPAPGPAALPPELHHSPHSPEAPEAPEGARGARAARHGHDRRTAHAGPGRGGAGAPGHPRGPGAQRRQQARRRARAGHRPRHLYDKLPASGWTGLSPAGPAAAAAAAPSR